MNREQGQTKLEAKVEPTPEQVIQEVVGAFGHEMNQPLTVLIGECDMDLMSDSTGAWAEKIQLVKSIAWQIGSQIRHFDFKRALNDYSAKNINNQDAIVQELSASLAAAAAIELEKIKNLLPDIAAAPGAKNIESSVARMESIVERFSRVDHYVTIPYADGHVILDSQAAAGSKDASPSDKEVI